MSTARVDGAPPPTTTTTDADAVDRVRFESAVSVLDARVDDDDDDDWNEWSLRDDVVILALTCALAGSYVVAFSSVVGFGAETFRALRGDQHERAGDFDVQVLGGVERRQMELKGVEVCRD